jgi:hypothetical protein
MGGTTVEFLDEGVATARRFRTGVCLHGHTMHSEECLSFLPRYLHHVPGVSQIVSNYERSGVDFARAYWTPPLSPASALDLEREQIANLGLDPLVSLTDHDSIEAGMTLQLAWDRSEAPVSVEWTVPYERSILHFGIHNLPRGQERAWISEMAAFTAAPDERRLPAMLRDLAESPEVLIVLNHPYWLEEGVEEPDHRRALARLLRECLEWIDAFEINGTRSWPENSRVVELAETHARPVISGGDRHACEPSACINLTNAASFAEFVAEVKGGQSTLLMMPQYSEPMGIRVLEAARDILRPYPEYPGRAHWTDRIFYRCDDGMARPLSVLWKGRVPWMVNGATALVQLAANSGMRLALRHVLARGEMAL